MQFQPLVLINITLAFIALFLYFRGSYCFYINKSSFLWYLGGAIFLDILAAILGSFKITPTTIIQGSDFVPWNSTLFILHVTFASFGFFGFILLFIYVLVKGTKLSYPRLRKFQFQILLPAWLFGESIALVNSLLKIFLQIRIYDYF